MAAHGMFVLFLKFVATICLAVKNQPAVYFVNITVSQGVKQTTPTPGRRSPS